MKNKKHLILYFLVIICLLINVFFINQLKFSITINEANNSKIMLKTSLLQTNTISGEGTMENPYQISTEEQLFWFSEFVNQGNTNIYAALTNDITINNNVLNSNGELNDGSFKQWIPIGNEDNRFQGIFDGNNYTISGLYVKDENNCYIGLFGRINKGYIINVNVKDSYFYGKQFVGGIVGDNTGVVKDCSSNCYISGSLEAIGGISGGNFGTIENCYSEGKICGSSFVSTEMNSSGKYYDTTVYCQAIGGITGGNYGVIENCYNTGDISGSSNIGGITGWNNGPIVNCYNKGNINCDTVSSHAYAGGIAGYGSILASITNCYNTGDVTSKKHDVGGIIGYVESSSKNGITKCYNTGNISGHTYVGGIVGYNQVAIKYCYNQGNITGNRYVGGIVGFNKASKKTYGSLLACYTIGEVIGQVVGSSAQPMDLGVVTGYNNQGNISNCYYLESIGNSLSEDTLSISKTLEQFTNGEVTYLLNSSLDIEIYKQTLEVDTYPNYTGKNVYYNDEENTYQNHIHKWEYVIENNEIVVRCNNSECSNNYGGSIKIIEPSSLIYTGNAIQPEVSITSKLNDEVIITLLEINNSKLIDGKSINVGEYQINVTVKDETISLKYSIIPLDLSEFDVNIETLTFNGSYQNPNVVIKNENQNLVENTDYIIESDSKFDASNYTLQIKGIGNYTGEVSKQWKILKKDITISAISQNILYGKNIKYDAYTENGLLEGHNLNLSLIPNTNNITSSGKISIVINDITYDLVSVLNNYNITTIPGNLTIEPDLTNINNLSIENVKSSDYEKINQVIQMMNTAERENALEEDKQRWDTIINTCNSLINKIETTLQEINNLTILVNNYDASKINSNDINDFNNLSNQIDSLIISNNTTNQEAEQLNNLKKQLNILQNNIDNVIKENERLKTEVLKYKDKALTTDKEKLSNLLEAIEKQLTLTNLTDEEIINLNNNKLIIEAEIQKINLLIETVSEKVNIVLNYNESTVNANDKETLINLINDIKTLTTNTSLSYLEINELNRAKIKANNLVTTINNITNKIYIIDSQITEELVINIDNYELIINCLNNIDNILSSSNLTNEEKTHLNELQEKAKKYVLTINNAQKALQSENIKKVISINEQNVKLDNKDDLLKAQSEINLLWTNYVNNYTTSEKELIKNYLQNISNSLVIIENAENVVDDIAKISIKTFTKEINKVKEKYENLSDYEKTLVDNATNNKLDSIIKTKTIIFVVVTGFLGITLIVFFVKWINKKQKRHN